MLITHNKNLNPLLNLVIKCISDKSVSQILSIKDEYTFFYYCLIIGLYNSLVNSLFDIYSFLKPSTAKIYLPT